MVRVGTTSNVYYAEFHAVKQASGIQFSSFFKPVTIY